MGVETPDSASPDESMTAQDAAVVDLDRVEPAEGSSPAAEGEKFDLLSVVRNAVQKPAEDAASPAGQEVSDQPQAEETASAPEPKEPDDEGFSDVPFHTHPRFKALVAQRNQYREGAKQFEQVQSFLREQGLTSEDAADALIQRALMKSNPVEAWKQLKPAIQQLLIAAGEVLPDDLKARVGRGEMTRDAALEFARLRAAQTSGEQAREAAQQRAAQAQTQAAVQAIQTSVGEWERDTRRTDPDFEAKLPALQGEVLRLQMLNGKPNTPEGARKQVMEAYMAINDRFVSSRAPKPQQRPVTGGRVASGNIVAQPKSFLDVVKNARLPG